MSERAYAIQAAQSIFDSGQFSAELSWLVSRPTESQNPQRADEMPRYLEELILPRLTKSGFTCGIHENRHGNPFLVARRIEDEKLPTILAYGHGDVTRGQEDEWSDGAQPFELREDKDRLIGRGTADNKGQHLINLIAQECVIAKRGRLGFNSTWLIEMGEETGSPGLEEFCNNHKELLDANVLIASDGPRLSPDLPLVFLGARGAINFNLSVDLRDGAHHSGNWGGVLADPAIILAHAISTITDKNGKIQIPEWHPTSLSQNVRELIATLPLPTGPKIDAYWGDETLTPQERIYDWNAFAVLAMESGVPAAPVNAIAGKAHAICQLRFVIGTNEADILPALRRHLDRLGLQHVRIKQEDSGFFTATRSAVDNPWVAKVTESLRKTLGVDPHIAPNLGGSLPNHVFTDVLCLPTIWIPHSYGGCNQHAPDEHMLHSVARQALGVMAGLYWDLGLQNTTDIRD